MNRWIVSSGGYDPLHIGHIRHFHEAYLLARRLNAKLLVMLNTDDWCRAKGKGHPFYPEYDIREAIVASIRWVDRVVPAIGNESSMKPSFEHYIKEYDIVGFAKGGDRTAENMPLEEVEACERLGITIYYGVGGGAEVKQNPWENSSKILENYLERVKLGQLSV